MRHYADFPVEGFLQQLSGIASGSLAAFRIRKRQYGEFKWTAPYRLNARITPTLIGFEGSSPLNGALAILHRYDLIRPMRQVCV
jgi:hypothetical protein